MKTFVSTVKLLKAGPPNETIFVLGTQGSGKTTLIANIAINRKRTVIFDTKEDYSPEFFGPQTAVCKSGGEFLTALNSGNPRIIVQLWHTTEPEELFAECCGMFYRWQILNRDNPALQTWFVLDELNKFVHVNSCPPAFADIILRGRSAGIFKLFGAQWFNTVPAWVRDGFSEVYAFAHTDECGLEKLTQFGFVPEEVATLPQFTCLHSFKGQMEKISLVPETISSNDNKNNTTEK